MLLRNPGKLLSHRQLLHDVWGPGYDNAGGNLRLYMAQLRRKLEPDPARPRWLITEPGMGYRYQPPDPPSRDARASRGGCWPAGRRGIRTRRAQRMANRLHGPCGTLNCVAMSPVVHLMFGNCTLSEPSEPTKRDLRSQL